MVGTSAQHALPEIMPRESDKTAASLQVDLSLGRYGDACDKCVALIAANDYRGIKGLHQVKAKQAGNAQGYVDFLLQKHEPTFLMRRALYPAGFDEGEFYASIIRSYPEYAGVVADMHFNKHPLIVIDSAIKSMKIDRKLTEREIEFLRQFGEGMGLSKNDISFLLG